ncbi:uncharacterized protein LOC131614552 [Vicia villosa]|uniref:uncharacterized protein LOC131614552 n=1 Tax=Vicia villosa TaxID=3911 RepID=UPI00273A9F87|nr:uncharacterized protein LOC131614552 [Vicia villosa]
MWGNIDVEWSFLDANGALGGILTMWKKELFSLNYSFRDEGFLGLCVEKEGKLIYFVNVYAFYDKDTRRRTWKNICEFKNNNIGGSWCIGGYFNSISSLYERIGVTNGGHSRELRFFNEFIEVMDLVDLSTIGGKFTWFKSNGKAMSRLDRFLLSKSFVEDWKVDGQHTGNVLEDVVKKRLKVAEDFWENKNKKEGLLRIKSRQLWLSEGDDNTHFFHNSLKDRRRRNSLCAIETRRGRMEEVTKIKYFIFKHFEGFFKEEDAIWSCGGNKSPGPDGYSLEFFKRFWFLLKDDLMKLCNDFHSKGTLVKAITTSFLALIPKKKNPQDLIEYRPICLVGSIYKILAKILAARMRGVLDKLVLPNQTAFVPDRSMMDGVLMVNEILDWAKRKKKGCLIIKVDFKKAYDSISWIYLRWIMGRMGFGKRWLKWMESCIFTSHMFMLVNGSATKEFKVQRGLRQGDPISPFLFVIAMEGLSTLMNKSVEVGDLNCTNMEKMIMWISSNLRMTP